MFKNILFALIIITIGNGILHSECEYPYDIGPGLIVSPLASGDNPLSSDDLVIEIVNFTKTDSIRNCTVKWAVTDWNNYSDLDKLDWSSNTVSFTPALSPTDTILIPHSEKASKKVGSIFTADIGISGNKYYQGKMLIVVTTAPNGECDKNTSNDTLRYNLAQSRADAGVYNITAPNSVQVAAESGVVEAIVPNYGNTDLYFAKIRYAVTDTSTKYDDVSWSSAEFDLRNDKGDPLPSGSFYQDTIFEHNFAANEAYLIWVEIEKLSTIDKVLGNIIYSDDQWSDNNLAVQFVAPYDNSKTTNNNARVVSIDSPSPKNFGGKKDVWATVQNTGPQPLKNLQVQWNIMSATQPWVVTPLDIGEYYSPQRGIWKIYTWQNTNFIFNPPLDSGEYMQVKITEFDFDSNADNVVIATAWKPNGSGGASGDSARCFLGSYLLGNYTVGDSKTYKSQFEDLQDVDKHLNSIKMPSYPNDDNSGKEAWQIRKVPMGFAGGASFNIKPGNYKGLNFSRMYPNQSSANYVSYAAQYADSLGVEIKPDDGETSTFTFSNMEYLGLDRLNMSLGSDNAPVVHIKSGTKNIKVSRSILHGASVSDTEDNHSTIFIEGKVDSSEISSSTILNGSYGVLVKAESSDKMNTIVLDGLDLAGQSAVGISMLNQMYPVVNGCYIDNNRLEIVNSLSPYAGNNRIVINGNTPSTKGYGYSDKPYSGIGFISCSDTSVVNNNNVCIETNGFYGVHYKDCKQAANPNQKSVINNNSIQSYRSGIQIENSDMIIMNKTSVDYRGSRNDNNAALFIDSESSGIEISKMILNSSTAGWAVLLGKKDVLANSAVNNFYSNEQQYFGKVLDGNKNLNLNEWKSYFKFPGDQQNSFSVDPEFYEDCDLITCNITIKGNGYEECITGNPPAHIYPEKDQEGLASSSVLFEWQNIFDSHAYWLQVNKSEDFGGIIGKDDEVQAENDLIIDEQDIKDPYFAMFGLEPNTTYYWRVRIYGQERRSKWSESQKFTTGNFTDVQIPAKTKHYHAFVAPNPANQNSMLVFDLPEGEEMRIGLYDLLGNNLGEIKYMAHQGRNIIPLGQINNSLSQGLYFVNIRGNQNELLKFVAE